MTVEELKHALINFNSIYKWWELNSQQYQTILHELEGVKGIRYDNVIGRSRSTLNLDQKKIKLIEEKDKLVAKNKYYEDTVKEVYDFIEWLDEPYNAMVMDKYFKELSDMRLEDKYGYHRTQIWRIISKKIVDYVNMQRVT